MNKRILGKTGIPVSEIGLGTWQLGTRWGEDFNEKEAFAILEATQEQGVTFIDTADVYNGGESERVIGEYMNAHRTDFYVTTKCGRRLNPHTADMYTPDAMEEFVDGSLKRLQMERLDMILLHCPPTSVYQKDEVFARMEQMKKSGKIAHYGVSIETVAEGIQAMEYDIAAMEVIFNMFRLKPTEELFAKTIENNVGVIVRVPLASGLLTGKYNKETSFHVGDHRTFNRNGEAFDKGETFSGVDYNLGLQAVEELKKAFDTKDLIPYALRYVLMHDAVTTVIPGASKVSQLIANVKASELEKLTETQMNAIKHVYDTYIKDSVHKNW